MQFLIVAFLIYMVFNGDRKNIFTNKQFNLYKFLIGIFILASFGGAIFPLLGVLLFLAEVLFPVWIIWKVYLKCKEKSDNSGSFNAKNDESGSYYGSPQFEQRVRGQMKKNAAPVINKTKSGFTGLTKSANKRRKILYNFNKKYELYLTDSQIQRIVDASYYCPEWEKEISDMEKEYASVYEWYQGDTAWLRAYLRVFRVQSISSDFEQQKEICIAELDQIFSNSSLANVASDDKVIRAINDKYYTAFDDVSFMIEYRFLKENGHNYEMESRNVIPEYESELDALRKKYEEIPG